MGKTLKEKSENASEKTRTKKKTKKKAAKKKPHAPSASSGFTRIHYTYKEGSGKRPASPLRPTAKPPRHLYSPIEADELKRRAGISASPKTRRAKRVPVLKPAPLPPTASKNPLRRKITGIFTQLREHSAHIDYIAVCLVALLSVIGILAVHSATLTKGTNRFDIMQIGMTTVGFCLMLVLSFVDYDSLTKNYRWVLILNSAMLLFTAIFGTGADGGGDTNHNWIRFGPVGIQPAEIGKILYIITFAAHLDNVKHRINHIKTLVGLMLHAGLFIGLIFLEKDTGQATVYIVITAVMLFAARLSLWYFVGAGAAGLALAPILWQHMETYQRERILVGFNPELDPLYRGYQAIQSKTAIAAGGLTGLGYRKGLITQTTLLPAKQTDMIFAVIGEEAGFIGAMATVLLLFGLSARLFRNALCADKMSGSLICAGVGGMILYQAIENIGMCLGLLPVIGITLPFVSYGGSSVLGMYLAMGVALSVYAKKNRLYFGT